MRQVLLIGSPNSGKSLLFNKLTGLSHKVANFPGVTIGLGSGRLLAHKDVELIDFPGIYSLQPISNEERVAVKAFKAALSRESVETVICLLDATRLDKGLLLTLQVIEACQHAGKAIIVVANMMDTLDRHALSLDIEGLSKELGVVVLALSAKTGRGIEALNKQLGICHPGRIASNGLPQAMTFGNARNHCCEIPKEDLALELTVSADFSKFPVSCSSQMRSRACELAHQFAFKGDLLIREQSVLDSFFLHSFWGALAFLLIMFLFFQSIFTWAAPLMDAVESGLGEISHWMLPLVPEGFARAFLSDAVFGGLGAFLVFVPQIFILTIVVGILEDTGYLARAAVICHKPLRWFGLTGKSFVPMLSGVACAIPGIYAARTVDSPVKRWLTYCAVPLMPCSARLPVYALLIAVFIPETVMAGGLVGYQGLALFGLYFFGIFCGLLVTAFISKTRPAFQEDMPFVLEMPPYRWPSWLPILRNSWDRSHKFITNAGGVIFMVTVVVWVLGYFPNYGASLQTSWLGNIGKIIEPLFLPLGLDWMYGVAIITSFLAREVFVGTLGTMMGIEGADENVASLASNIQSSGLELASGVALVVFFAIALQCVSTLAVLKKETGSWRFPMQLFVGYGFLAYGLAWVSYHVISFF